MIEQKAKVIRSDDSTIWLQAERQSTCDKCQVKKGCGTGLLSEHVGRRFSTISVPKKHDVQPGQQMNVSIPEEALLHGAYMMYLLPILFMFAGAGLSRFMFANELLEIITGLAGLMLGFYWVKNRLKHQKIAIETQLIEEK
ncbi:SoxR reducing system RseC family protein [Methylophaga sp.]|uniref:SoxR reducing system RseC family protein n=1 Tax=Methylophaga sp. TaxID=2024840 RepID=UPI002718B30B|nr:SoxR reducing system RseC family protein [Methylophaga sp.]MDO8825397.1 SoxR reducing system RseC family protein [Methylophaga sp.]